MSKKTWLIRNGWPLLFPVLLIIPPLFSCLRTEEYFLYAGLGSQVLGISTVIIGIRKKLKDFDIPSIFSALIAWNRFTLEVQDITHKHSLEGDVHLGIDRQIPTEQQIEHLRSDLKKLRGYYDKDILEVNKRIDSLNQHVYNSFSRIKDISTKNFRLELLGALLLLIGVIFSTLPKEMENLFNIATSHIIN